MRMSFVKCIEWPIGYLRDLLCEPIILKVFLAKNPAGNSSVDALKNPCGGAMPTAMLGGSSSGGVAIRSCTSMSTRAGQKSEGLWREEKLLPRAGYWVEVHDGVPTAHSPMSLGGCHCGCYGKTEGRALGAGGAS